MRRSVLLLLLILAAACESSPSEPALLPTGALDITAETSGALADPDGYLVTLQDGNQQSLGENGAVRFRHLAPGDYEAQLSDYPSSCTVPLPNPRAVTIRPGAVARLTFQLSCAEPGTVEISVATEGEELDGDGYVAILLAEIGQGKSISVNGKVTFTLLRAGSYTASLTGLAANCSVQGQERPAVSVLPGQTTRLGFRVLCARPPPGSLLIEVSIRSSFRFFGFGPWNIQIDGSPAGSIPTNGSVLIQSVGTGPHTVKLLAGWCRVSNSISGGSNSAEARVTIPPDGFGKVRFSVTCP